MHVVDDNLEKMKLDDNLIVSKKGGGCIINKKPIFATNGQLLLTVQNNIILAYSTVTGELVRTYNGIEYSIVDIFICPDNDKHLIACSVSGELFVFDIHTAADIRKTELRQKDCIIKQFCMVPSETDSYFILITFEHIEKNENYMHLFSSTSLKLIRKLPIIFKNHEYLSVGGAIENKFFAIIQKNRLFVSSILKNNEAMSHFIGSKRYFTVVCCHPNEQIVATGDNTGRVVIWRDIFSKNAKQTVYHWHTLAVKCISFSHTGSYFYSGGKECVLIKWDIDAPQHKSCLPRMSAPLVHVSVSDDNSKVAIASDDNAIQVIDAQRKLKCTIQHMSWGVNTGSHTSLFPAGLNYDSRTWSLVLNSRVGHIQFYSPQTKMLLYNLDITGQNQLTQERDQTIVNTEVVKVAISRSGLWIATVEERDDNETNLETCLKFWNFDESSQSWNLNTCVVLPHEGGVTSLTLKPSLTALSESYKLMCVTTGNDRKIKLWDLVNTSNINEKRNSWRCSSVIYYRDLPVTNACFSYDGSLLAACFHSSLTVWIPDTCELKCSLTYSPYATEQLKHVLFGNTDQCHLVVTASEARICVWNLLTLALIWTVPLNVKCLCGDPISNVIAAFTKDNSLFVFTPGSSLPLYINNNICKLNVQVLSACFFPHRVEKDRYDWQKHSQLYFITSEEELLTLENPDIDEIYDINLEVVAHKHMDNSIFNVLHAEQATSVLSKSHHQEQISTGLLGSTSIKSLINQSSHVTAPMRLLCNSVLQSMVLTENTLSNNKNEVNGDTYKLKFSDYGFADVESDDSDDNEIDVKKDKKIEIPAIMHKIEKSINDDTDKVFETISKYKMKWASKLVNNWSQSSISDENLD